MTYQTKISLRRELEQKKRKLRGIEEALRSYGFHFVEGISAVDVVRRGMERHNTAARYQALETVLDALDIPGYETEEYTKTGVYARPVTVRDAYAFWADLTTALKVRRDRAEQERRDEVEQRVSTLIPREQR